MTMTPGVTRKLPSERMFIFLVGAVQFVNILDFMMVMPLGPDFAKALGIPSSEIGYVGGAYTAAAAISGLIGALFLDRFDRRPALALAMLGLGIGTLAGAFARDLQTLVLARALAGVFGGPATSIALSIISDVIPPERRGRAMGMVMMSFAVSSVLGVPAGLQLATAAGWKAPFLAVAALVFLITVAVYALLPSLTIHLEKQKERPQPGLLTLFRKPEMLLAYCMTLSFMCGHFLLVPNISAYVQNNLHVPRESIWQFYLAGGAANLVVLPGIGRLVDRFGSTRIAVIGTVLFAADMYLWFFDYRPAYPVIALFTGFMVFSSFRSVPYSTLSSKVPAPDERARFMSIQSACQHLAAAAGAFVSTRLLVERKDGTLEGVPRVAALAIAVGCILPVLIAVVERRVVRRGAAAGPLAVEHVEIVEGG